MGGWGWSNQCSTFFVADFVLFWRLFGNIIRNKICNINVQNEGGGRGERPFEQCSKKQTIWYCGASLNQMKYSEICYIATPGFES